MVSNTLVVENCKYLYKAFECRIRRLLGGDALESLPPMRETKKCRNVVVCRYPLNAESSQIQVQ